jgi:hypothetical protein
MEVLTVPHFDEDGGDQWLCQAPNHKGNRVQSSKVKSEWRPDITGHKGAGNSCPPCVKEHDERIGTCDHGIVKTKECLRCWLEEEDDKEYINPLDYVDNPAELDLQRELRRIGVKNTPRRTICQHCGPDERQELKEDSGMVGETVLTCPTHGIVWEDAEGAIRMVY